VARRKKKRILDLPINRKDFDLILAGAKTADYRERTGYWERRLEGRKYDEIRFRSGNAPGSPVMWVKYLRVDKLLFENFYEIQFGKILRLENCRRKRRRKV
jgi:hypothetical protein